MWPLPDAALHAIAYVICATALGNLVQTSWTLRKLRRIQEHIVWLIAQGNETGLGVTPTPVYLTKRATVSTAPLFFRRIETLINETPTPGDLAETVLLLCSDVDRIIARSKKIGSYFNAVYVICCVLLLTSLLAALLPGIE